MRTKQLVAVALAVAVIILATSVAFATPSTTFWTPSTTYIQPFGVPHVTYDSYFNREADFPTDVGLTIGFLPWKKFQGELGFDLFLPSIDPAQFNFKLGVPEDALFKWSPGINAGVFAMGTEADVNDFDIVQVNVGKTIPHLGSFSAGYYQALNKDLMTSADGDDQSAGFMVAYYRTLEPLTDRLAISADYMSGENIFGGGGVGMYFWFTKQIDLIMGWVWFNDRELNPPDGMFTIQLDIDFDFKRKLPE